MQDEGSLNRCAGSPQPTFKGSLKAEASGQFLTSLFPFPIVEYHSQHSYNLDELSN